MKDYRVSLMKDFYGSLLHGDKAYNILTMYYDRDLSLQEIADEYSMTRQAVRDFIVRAEADMRKYEDKLGLVEKYYHNRAELSEAVQTLIQEGKTETAAKIQRVIDNL